MMCWNAPPGHVKWGHGRLSPDRIWPKPNLARIGVSVFWPFVFLHLWGAFLCSVVVVCKIFWRVSHAWVSFRLVWVFNIFGLRRTASAILAVNIVLSSLWGSSRGIVAPTLQGPPSPPHFFSAPAPLGTDFFFLEGGGRGALQITKTPKPKPEVVVFCGCG